LSANDSLPWILSDYRIRPRRNIQQNPQAELFRGFKINDRLELVRLFRQICPFGTFENSQRKIISSLDDSRTLLVQELVAAIRTEEFYPFMPELMPVAIEFSFALRAGHPKYFCHGSSSP
jgi:hypothetical protein